MKAQYTNRVMSSFNLWFNHTLLEKGEAYQNTVSQFYPIKRVYNGIYTYATPYNQIVSDFSITGAQIPTGVYLNNIFITTGVSGLKAIDYENGRVHFTTNYPSSVRLVVPMPLKSSMLSLPKNRKRNYFSKLSIRHVLKLDRSLLVYGMTNGPIPLFF